MHWAHVPLLAVMAMSGLQIWMAYPFLGPKGALLAVFPLQGFIPPSWIRAGEWLAGARHVHFAFMWLFALNGLAYAIYLLASGEWRRRLFLPRRDTRGVLVTAGAYLRLRGPPTSSELYNGLQRLAYSVALGLAALQLWSGLVLYKPVQLRILGLPLGGYEGARLVHTSTLLLLAGFTVTHVILVLLHPRTLMAMLTGKERR
jgi:thiosulfate reductase cytochrome b subunit